MMLRATMLAVASTCVVSSSWALPQLGAPVNMTVPSMNNGLKGTAMKGYRWVKLPADRQLELELEALGVDTWTGGMTEAVIAPDKWAQVHQKLLKDRDFEFHAEDVQDMLENDKEARRRHPYRRGMRNDEFYMAWRNLPEILDYVDFLKTLAPANMTITDIVAGETYEGNQMPGIRVLTGSGTAEPRPSFVMHGCHHSGEWITAMGMVYFIERLITTYGIDPALTRIADNYEFDLIPVMNIDGFLFGWDNDSFRTWRKTRSRHAPNLEAHAACELVTPGSCENCFGTDPNRNWDINWAGQGSSSNPCSGSYHGVSPFLEPEARTMMDFVRQREATIYIDHHCCGDMFLQPYGWTIELPATHDEMDAVWATAKVATDNLYGRNYRQGPTFTTIYPASGLGLDYMYSAGVPFSIATEMRSSNGNGPVSPVLPGSQELWEGVKAAGLFVLNNYEADDTAGASTRPVLRKRKGSR